ncbi:MAG: hypothetical protein AAB019_10060 [Planctomycetota bacterium]
MTKQEFYRRITNSKKDLIKEFLGILHKLRIPYCVIGGVALNAYCEPMVTLDFDCVLHFDAISVIKKELLQKGFRIKTHPYTWEITRKGSDVRIQLQRDQRYQKFIKKAIKREVLGYQMKVAQKKDLLKGKIWAYCDPTRNTLKREKDRLDIRRLISKYPSLKKK